MRPLVLFPMLLLVADCGPRVRQQRQPQDSGSAPAGFSIEAAVPGARLGSVAAFTFDSRGRPVVVAKDRKLATVLLDQNRDGVFETERVLTSKVTGVRGLWFDGRVLYLIGHSQEGQYGFFRLEDKNGDDEMDTFEQLSAFEGGAEAGPHDIRRGPDGLPTLLLGNGKWLRWNEDRRDFTLLAAGFGNPRTHFYEPSGEALVFDSGNDDDADLPGYFGARTIHATPGGDYGNDAAPPLAAMESYRHHAYPAGYRGSWFGLGSRRGTVSTGRLMPRGATFELVSAADRFAQRDALEVTGLETGPDGFVYFATSGPGNRGGLYRIRYTPGWRERWDQWWARGPEGVLAMARQPQPLSSWGHAALLRQKELFESRWAEGLEALAVEGGAASPDRVQAILLLQRFGPRPKADLLKRLIHDSEPSVRAAAIYVVGQQGSAQAKVFAAAALEDDDAVVRRRAAEAIVRMGLTPEEPEFAAIGGLSASLYKLLGDRDQLVRYSARLALERTPREEWKPRALAERDRSVALEGMLALIRTTAGAGQQEEREAVLAKLMPMLADTKQDAAARLRAVRLFTLAVTGVKDAALGKQAAALLLPQFPAAGEEPLNRELARALAASGEPAAIPKILGAIPKGDRNRPLQIHYVDCLRSIKDGWTAGQKEALLAWFQTAAEWRGQASLRGALATMFEAALRTIFTRQESRLARARIPKLNAATGAAAGLTPEEILEFQLSEAATETAAPPDQGKEIFAKRCAACHRFGEVGNLFGPELTGIESRLDKAAILEAILYPSRDVDERYRTLVVETADGHEIDAMVVREDDKVLLVKTTAEPHPISILKTQVRARRDSDKSIMPEGLLDGYDQNGIASLLAFLQAAAK